MKKKITAVFLAVMLSAQPWGMAYAGDFSDDISVESNEIEKQETELLDVEEESTEEDDSIDEEVYIEDLSIVSEPNKKEYDYGTVHSAKDFDLTGLAVKVSYSDQTQKILYFKKDGEVKTDSKGNKFYSEIDFWGE